MVKRRRLKSDFNQHYDNLACVCYSDQRFRSMMADTPAACSCPMCGNPRRFSELTVQERRHLPKLHTVD